MAAVALLLLYDGVCGFCNGVVRTILRYDKEHTMRFAPLQGDTAREILARHPALATIDTVIVVEQTGDGERLLVKSDASLRVAEYLGWPWKALLAGRILPRALRDVMYDGFAKIRYRVFGKYDACPVPDAAVRSRFMP